ncbi:hypothetical protein GGR55DRAFT_685436 [Xylaria sp. FL0064]|nr:hypothetical protein GGR55DRAFT_685436 [Xylaria sp. FL0064]
MSANASPIPQWVTDLSFPPAYKSKSGSMPDPPGYPSQAGALSKKQAAKEPKAQSRKQPTPEEMDTLKLKKAWEVALAPIKSLPMTFFMMYMSGNSLQIFSIMMVYMAFKNPIMGLVGTNQAFERFESDTNKAKILQVKLAYIVMQLVALAVGIWKVNGMGLLPTTRSDWLAWEAQRDPLEHAVSAL